MLLPVEVGEWVEESSSRSALEREPELSLSKECAEAMDDECCRWPTGATPLSDNGEYEVSRPFRALAKFSCKEEPSRSHGAKASFRTFVLGLASPLNVKLLIGGIMFSLWTSMDRIAIAERGVGAMLPSVAITESARV